ncbi:unnamed protein product [Oikopleura dioica]|uniref:Uncharacterized protein n=1 Tax=Oikopleura dioica TaxID=34765 RepID=E4X1F8_OIKDI|nr:unnamed protein product [Oikopleura dioica]
MTTKRPYVPHDLTVEELNCWRTELGKYQAGFCIKNTRPHHCGLSEPYLPIVAHISCKEELMCGVSKLGISVFFTCLSILIMLCINWRYEEILSSSAYTYTRIATILMVSLTLIATFIGMKYSEPLHRRVPSGIFATVMGAFSVLSSGYMMLLRGHFRHV